MTAAPIELASDEIAVHEYEHQLARADTLIAALVEENELLRRELRAAVSQGGSTPE